MSAFSVTVKTSTNLWKRPVVWRTSSISESSVSASRSSTAMAASSFFLAFSIPSSATILPETSARLALTAAEDLRLAFAGHPLELEGGQQVQITCSLGVAELKTGDTGGGALLARADAALYAAKAGGRNRTVPAP